MSLDQKFVHDQQVPAPYKIKRVTTDGAGVVSVDGTAITGTTVKLNASDKVVRVDANGTDTVTIQLPSVAIAEGFDYLIRVDDFGGGVTISDEDDSLEWGGDYTTDADGEYAHFKCINHQWAVQVTDIA